MTTITRAISNRCDLHQFRKALKRKEDEQASAKIAANKTSAVFQLLGERKEKVAKPVRCCKRSHAS